MLCKSGVGRCHLPVSDGCLIPTCFVCCSVAHKTYFVNRLYVFLKTRIDRSPSKRVFLHMLFRRERKPLSHHSRLKRHRRRLRKKTGGIQNRDPAGFPDRQYYTLSTRCVSFSSRIWSYSGSSSGQPECIAEIQTNDRAGYYT